MKYGLKIYAKQKKKIFPQIVEETPFDFVEAMIEPDADFSYLKNYKFEYVIHAPHSGFGVNIANPNKENKNRKAIGHAIKAADELDASIIIVHSGYVENKKCSLGNAINFIKNTGCDRIIIENLCPHPVFKTPHLGHSLEDILLLKSNEIDFCLDIGHASMNAYKTKENYLTFIKKMILMKPKHYHMMDCIPSKYKDHLHFGDGVLDIKRIKEMIPENSKVSIETKADKRLKDDFEYLRKI